MGALRKPVHQKIFSLFLSKQQLSHSAIAKQTALKPNLLSYYLRELLAQGVLEKRDDAYVVSRHAEHLIPQFKQVTGEESLKLPVVVFAIEHDGKILLLQRKNRPYAGYWGLPGGKILHHETISDAAKRISLRETGLPLDAIETCAVIDERVTDSGIDTDHTEGASTAGPFLNPAVVKSGWFIFVAKATLKDIPAAALGNCDWFDPHDLRCKIIPSDAWMITQALQKRLPVHEFTIEEKDGKILGFRNAVTQRRA
jgi:8-oxo-dGTP pyrophosphatase MutT (NUDIX family)